jgi:hypothetical protein
MLTTGFESRQLEGQWDLEKTMTLDGPFYFVHPTGETNSVRGAHRANFAFLLNGFVGQLYPAQQSPLGPSLPIYLCAGPCHIGSLSLKEYETGLLDTAKSILVNIEQYAPLTSFKIPGPNTSPSKKPILSKFLRLIQCTGNLKVEMTFRPRRCRLVSYPTYVVWARD